MNTLKMSDVMNDEVCISNLALEAILVRCHTQRK